MKTRLEKLWNSNKNLITNLRSIFQTDLNAIPAEYAASGFCNKKYEAYQQYKIVMNEIIQELASSSVDVEKFTDSLKYRIRKDAPVERIIADGDLAFECRTKINFAIEKINEEHEEKYQKVSKKCSTLEDSLNKIWNNKENLIQNIRMIFEKDLMPIPTEYERNGFYNSRWNSLEDYKRVKRNILTKLNSPDITEESFYTALTNKLYEMCSQTDKVDDKGLFNELYTKFTFVLTKMELHNPSLKGIKLEQEKERERVDWERNHAAF